MTSAAVIFRKKFLSLLKPLIYITRYLLMIPIIERGNTMMRRRFGLLLLIVSLCAAWLLPAVSVSAEDEAPVVTTDAQTAAKLGLLLGDGDGVTDSYLSKQSTRIQAAIISLRLQGKLEEATTYTGAESFSDASAVGKSNQAILGYLKSHPELGWNGTGGGKFNPLAPSTRSSSTRCCSKY